MQMSVQLWISWQQTSHARPHPIIKQGKNNQQIPTTTGLLSMYIDGSWDKETLPNAQEQRQQPHQISNPDNTENNPSARIYRSR